MLKRDELNHPESCLTKARDGEMLFVLLARDVAAPSTIRHWIAQRIASGKNRPGDDQLVEAEQCACEMERQRDESGK